MSRGVLLFSGMMLWGVEIFAESISFRECPKKRILTEVALFAVISE